MQENDSENIKPKEEHIEKENENENIITEEPKTESSTKNSINIENNIKKESIICHDKTINEVSDKKWSRFLIPRKNILEAKYNIEKNNISNMENINLLDYKNKEITILVKILLEFNENNLTYQWLEIPDKNDKIILVKKEHLLMLDNSEKESEIMDYNGKKYIVIPGHVSFFAKKYHITTRNEENILYLIKNIENNLHFVTKTIIKFAKEKRKLNDELTSLEITDINNEIIKVTSDSIRDLEDFNLYNEWVEVEDIKNNKIIVRKIDLMDCKEIYDKNLTSNCEIQSINDWKYDIYEINIYEQYSKNFPSKYYYYPKNNQREEYIEIKNIKNEEILVKTSLIEYYLTENLNDLSNYEEINDKNLKKQIINPKEIIEKILLSYDDILSNKGSFVEIITQSGSKHLVRINTIHKILQIANNRNEINKKNNVVSIKDNNGVKIITTLDKIKEINLNDNNTILLCFNDINQETCCFKKSDIIKEVNNILLGNVEDEYIDINDKEGVKKKVNFGQIIVKNNKLKRNKKI